MTETIKIPFEFINPIKFVGVNSSYPFCSIISQSKLIYVSGANVIMENTKNNEQKILFTNKLNGKIQLITHLITLYNQNILAIAIKDFQHLMNAILIVPLNDILYSQTKEKISVHYLKNIEEYETIKQMVFFEEGFILGIVSNYKNSSTFTMLRSKNGDILHEQKFSNQQIILKSLNLNKIACVSLLWKRANNKYNISLMAIEDLSRKFHYQFTLTSQQQQILEYSYEYHNEEILLIVLTNKSNLYFYKLNEFQIFQIMKINVSYLKKDQQYSATMFISTYNKIVISYKDTTVIGIVYFSFYQINNIRISFIELLKEKYPEAYHIESFKIAKNQTSLVISMQIDPNYNVNKQNDSNQQKYLQKIFKSTFRASEFAKISKQYSNKSLHDSQIDHNIKQSNLVCEQNDKYYIVVQMDILSNLINHQQQDLSIEPTFSVSACHNKVVQIAYCLYNNTMFALLSNKKIKYYNFNQKSIAKQLMDVQIYQDFQIGGFLFWQTTLNIQPSHIAIHPFNFTILFIQGEILKFHNYNNKRLFPSFLMTNIQNCSIASYSPLGDKLIISTNNSIIILNSYTLQIFKVINLANAITNRISSSTQKHFKTNKMISQIQFKSNEDILLLSSNNTFLTLSNHEKLNNFGCIEGKQKIYQVIYDKTNKYIIVATKNQILVLDRCNSSTRNKCQIIKRIQIKASCMYLLDDYGVLLIGRQDGVLDMIKWPDYNYEQLLDNNKNRHYLFKQAIISIKISKNLKYIYAISKSGSFSICQMIINLMSQSIPKNIKQKLIKQSQLSTIEHSRWYTSFTQEEQREGQIIKLRGQQSEISNHYKIIQNQLLMNKNEYIIKKKKQFQEYYLNQIKGYQQKLGIQKMMHNIFIKTDQLRSFRLAAERQQKDIRDEQQKELKQIFEVKSKIQMEYSQINEQNQKEKQQLIVWHKKLLQQLNEQLLIQQQKKGNINKADAYFQQQNIQQLNLQSELIAKQYKRVRDGIQQNECKQIMQRNYQNNTICSKNRNIKISISNLLDIISQCNQIRQKFELDMFNVIQQNKQKIKKKQQIDQIYKQKKILYDKLIITSQQLEYKLKNQVKLISKNQHRIQQLEKQIIAFQSYEGELGEKKEKIAQRILGQKLVNFNRSNKIGELMKQVEQNKQKNKQKFYKKQYLKNVLGQQMKNVMRQIQIDERKCVQKIKEQNSFIDNELKEELLIIQYNNLKNTASKLNNDLQKWNFIKSSTQHIFLQNFQKLKAQNLKLTYQYNDLVRLRQDNQLYEQNLIFKINKLKNDCHSRKNEPQKVDLKAHEGFSRTCFNSFVSPKNNDINKFNIKNKIIKKKLVCMSLHQQSGKFVTQA